MMAHLVSDIYVRRIPRKQGPVVHLMSKQAETVMVLLLHRRWAVEVLNQKPTWISQHSIRLTGDTKQILSIGQIEAEAKREDIKSIVINWCTAMPRTFAASTACADGSIP